MPMSDNRTAILRCPSVWATGVLLSLCCGCGTSQPSVESTVVSADLTNADQVQPTLPVTTADSQPGRQSNTDLEQSNASPQESALRSILISQPENAEAIFRLAGLLADRGKLIESLELLDGISPDNPKLGLPALGFAGDLNFAAAQFVTAKEKYRAVLKREPEAVPALRHLALILNRQGLRHQAAVYLRTLCKIGDIRQDELQALLSLPDSIYAERPTTGEPVSEFTGYYPIGALADARWEFSNHRFEQAREILTGDPLKQLASADANAFFARLLAATQRIDELGEWLAASEKSSQDQAEYWSAAAAYLIEQKKFEPAVRACAEAMIRDPSDTRAYFRMHQALSAIGEHEMASKFWERYLSLRKSIDLGLEIKAQPIPKVETLIALAEQLENLDRKLEAIMWRAIALHRVETGTDTQAAAEKNAQLTELNTRRNQVIAANDCFASNAEMLCGLELSRYPLPDWSAMSSRANTLATDPSTDPSPSKNQIAIWGQPSEPHYSDDAESVGLTHQYRVAAKPQSEQFAIYQSMGGGVAVLDYDLNGQPDLYFAQSACDPPEFVSAMSNQLFRQQDERLIDVTNAARSEDHRYTLGVTSCDWNQDGFPDLACSNLRGPQLLINNGDGTFRKHHSELPTSPDIMCSSLAIGDVTGDGLPELVQVNYADDPTLIRKAGRDSKGLIEQLSPTKYKPASNWIVWGDADGNLKHQIIETEKANGLGIVIGDFDMQPGNEVFIANDVCPDQFLKFTLNREVTDTAMIRGCALGGRGTRTASMGIAVADFDHNESPDIHITNFEDDSNSLLLNNNGQFVERAVLYGLDQISWPLVGFGCQAVDYDLNGTSDLIILNGRVEQPTDDKHEYLQPSLIVANRMDRMQSIEVQDPTGYFKRKHLGRGLAKLDFNGDGRIDVVATHLEEPSALLINRTETPHHWIRFQLVGTTSERDAIGAKIQIQYGDQRASEWVTSGDGYMARNEAMITFGIGTHKQVDRILVVWPNGHKQRIDKLEANHSWLIVQNDDAVFESLRPSRH